jgi:hypothetical protein
MTNQEFINRIRKEYLRARKVLIDDSKITRGTSHSISSLSEDVFAKYISDLISDDYEIWIDPQISVTNIRNTSGKRVKTFRPDICVYNKNKKKVDLIFDLKMDLGYKRNEFINYSNKRYEEINEIRQQEGTWNKNDSKLQFTFSESLQWNYVVLSEGNITKEQMQIIKDYFKGSKYSKLSILSSGEHLNSYKKNPIFTINKKAFSEINLIVKKICG